MPNQKVFLISFIYLIIEYLKNMDVIMLIKLLLVFKDQRLITYSINLRLKDSLQETVFEKNVLIFQVNFLYILMPVNCLYSAYQKQMGYLKQKLLFAPGLNNLIQEKEEIFQVVLLICIPLTIYQQLQNINQH